MCYQGSRVELVFPLNRLACQYFTPYVFLQNCCYYFLLFTVSLCYFSVNIKYSQLLLSILKWYLVYNRNIIYFLEQVKARTHIWLICDSAAGFTWTPISASTLSCGSRWNGNPKICPSHWRWWRQLHYLTSIKNISEP